MAQTVKSPVFQLKGTGFDSRSISLGFEVNKVALEQGFLEFLGGFFASIILLVLEKSSLQ